MPIYPTNCIFMRFGEKSFLIPQFLSFTIAWQSGGYGPKKLINTLFIEFGFLPSLKHDSIVFFLCNSASNFKRKHTQKKKIKINNNWCCISFFAFYLKNRRVELSFQCRNEFCMPKYPNNRIFMGFGEKRFLSPNFCPYYSMAIWRLMGQTIDQYPFA